MARGRMLNKTVSRSRQFDLLPDDTCRLLATWTIAHLDVNGVFYADPVMVRSLVFSRRTDIEIERIESYLATMQDVGLIVVFEANGDMWQYWPGFLRNQIGLRTDRERPAFPPPPADLTEQYGDDAGYLPDGGGMDDGEYPAEEEVNRREGEGKVSQGQDNGDGGGKPAAGIYRLFEKATGGIVSSLEWDKLQALCLECEEHRVKLDHNAPGAAIHGEKWVAAAIEEMAANRPKRPCYSYVESIIENWQRNGFMIDGRARADGRSPPTGNPRVDASIAAAQELIAEQGADDGDT